LGQFNLSDIPPAPRGTPQIEVTFDIDANGNVHVSAKDKATGKENKITIKANSGLTEEEIQRMVNDAETHAEEDKKTLALVNARNSLEGLVHSVEKMLKDHGEGMDADEKSKIEQALKNAKDAEKSESVEEIEAKTTALAEASHKLTEKMYAAQAGAAAGGDGHAGSSSTAGASGASHAGAAEGKDNVVDAEFEEVKDPGKA